MALFELMAKLGLDKSEFESGLDDAANDAEKSGGSIGGALGKAAQVGVAALTAATGAAAAFAKSSVDAGMSFDASMSQVAATMGKTTEEMESEVGSVDLAWGTFSGNLREYAQEMGANTAFSATQAADALNYMALAGYDTQTAMEMLPNVLNLAAAGGMELATASDMVTDASSALGLSLDETGELVDKMAQASSKSNTSVSQLGNAILVVGGTAKNLAGGTTELSTALGILANNGVKGAEGGTALRNIILSLSAPTDKSSYAMRELGLEVFDAQGNMRPLNDIFADLNVTLGDMTQGEQTQALNKIFNKVDLKSVNALLANTGDGIENIGSTLANCGVEWEKYSGLTDHFTGSIEDRLAEWSTELRWTNLSTMEGMKEAAEWIADEYGFAEEDALKMVQAVSESIYGQETAWSELAANIDEASGVSVSSITSALEQSGIAWDKYKDTAWASAGGGIQSLADEIIYNLDQMGHSTAETAEYIASEYDLSMEDAKQAVDLVKESLDNAQGAAQKMADTQLDNLTGDITLFGSALEGLQIAISDQITPVLREFVKVGSDGLSEMTKGFKEEGLAGAVDAFGQMISDGIAKITELLPDLIEAGAMILGAVVDGIVQNIPQVADAAVEIISKLGNALGDNLPDIIPQAVSIITTVVETLIEHLPDVIDAGLQIVTGLITGILNAIPELVNAVPELVSSIISTLEESGPKIVDAGKNLLSRLTEDVPAIISNIVDTLPQILDAIGEFLVDHGTDMANAGVELLSMIVGYMGEIISTIVEKLPEIISGIVGFFGDHIDEIAEIGITLFVGLLKETGKIIIGLTEKASEVVGGVLDFIDGKAAEFVESGKKLIGEVGSGISDGASAAIEAVTGFVNDAKSGIGGILTYVGSEFKQGWETGLGEVSEFFGGVADSIAEKAGSAKEGLGSLADSALDMASTTWNNAMDALGSAADSALDSIGGYVDSGWEKIQGFGDWVGGEFLSAWGLSWEDISDMSSVTSTLEGAITDIQGGFEGLTGFLGSVFTGDWESAWGDVTSVFEDVSESLGYTSGDIESLFQSLMDFVGIDFSGSWEDAWNNISGLFGSAFDNIVEAAKTPINDVIEIINWAIGGIEGALNAMIGAMNQISVRIPDFVPGIGGTTFGINLDTVGFGRIDYFAKGGTLEEGEQAIVGEYAPEHLQVVNGRAVVTPLNTGRFGGDGITINVYPQRGQSEEEIALAVQRKLAMWDSQRKAAYV